MKKDRLRMFRHVLAVMAMVVCLAAPTYGVTNILANPEFTGPPIGADWGSWGNAGFNDFFGGNAHASLFGDSAENYGGVFQVDVPASAGITYQLELLDTRIEENWDADLFFGLEYYASDDATKLGETFELIDAATRIANGMVSNNVFSMQGTAVAGTAFVRPVVRFENVNGSYSGETQANTFVFNTFLSVAAAPGEELLKNPGFDDLNTNGVGGDYWGSYGNVSFDSFFTEGVVHVSLWGDTAGNTGGIYQQGILGEPGKDYLLTLKNVRIEDDFDGEIHFGLEYYGADDFNKLSETIVAVDTVLTGFDLAYSMVGTAVPGTVYIRPIIYFDNVATSGTDRNVFIFEVSLTEPAPGYDMLKNPGFEDVDTNGEFGDGWGKWGTANFNDFWGGNPHGSLFGSWFDSTGGIFQTRIPGVEGLEYQFDLLDTRVEENWDADLYFGLEYYSADDGTKIGESLVPIDTATRLALGHIDGNVFSMQGTAPTGTAYVRPVVFFDNVNEAYLNEEQSGVFVFKSFLGKAPAAGEQYIKNAGFGDSNGDGNFGDYWGAFGSAGFHEFFGANNAHASFFADQVDNEGGVYQQAILGEAGAEYRFDLLNVRIEENFDADLFFGMEFFGDDDNTKIGEVITMVDTSTTGDGLSFTTSGVAPAGTVYVRPIIRFDNVGTPAASQTNVFVFATALSEVVEIVPGDSDGDGDVDLDDFADFVDCLEGPEVIPAGAGCLEYFDFDGDDDVDLGDFAALQGTFTGPQ